MTRLTLLLSAILSFALFSCEETSQKVLPVNTYQLFLEELSNSNIDSLKTYFQKDLSYQQDSIYVFHGRKNKYDNGNFVLEIRDSSLRADAIELNDSLFGQGTSTFNNQYKVWRAENISQPRLEISWEPHPTLEHIMVFTKREKL